MSSLSSSWDSGAARGIPCSWCGVPIEWVARWGAEYWVHVEMPDGMRTGGYIYCIDKDVPGSLLHVAEPPLSPDSGRVVVAAHQAGRSPDREPGLVCVLCGVGFNQAKIVHDKIVCYDCLGLPTMCTDQDCVHIDGKCNRGLSR